MAGRVPKNEPAHTPTNPTRADQSDPRRGDPEYRALNRGPGPAECSPCELPHAPGIQQQPGAGWCVRNGGPGSTGDTDVVVVVNANVGTAMPALADASRRPPESA